MARVIKRGEIWIVDLEPGTHQEMHKKRPALIVSHNKINEKTAHAIIVPASTKVPHTIGIEMIHIGKKEGLDKPSVLLPIYIRSIDQERLIKKLGTVSEETLNHVDEVLKLILAIS